MKKRIFNTKELTAQALAEELYSKITRAAGQFNIAVSGGSTPALMFSILADLSDDKLSWENIHFFWVDERSVPPGDDQSNYKMTSRTLLSRISIPEGNIHRVRGEGDAETEAIRYSEEIRKFVPLNNSIPVFDVILLGMGDDGHTASIFPDQIDLFYSQNICEAAVHPQSGQKRVTLTGKVLNKGKSVYFLVCGKSKTEVLTNVFDNKGNYPALLVDNAPGELIYYLDSEAAGSLK